MNNTIKSVWTSIGTSLALTACVSNPINNEQLTTSFGVDKLLNHPENCSTFANDPIDSIICSLEQKDKEEQFTYINNLVDLQMDTSTFVPIYRLFSTDEVKTIRSKIIQMYLDWIYKGLSKEAYYPLQLDITVFVHQSISFGIKRRLEEEDLEKRDEIIT